jgi:hypothetical protein
MDCRIKSGNDDMSNHSRGADDARVMRVIARSASDEAISANTAERSFANISPKRKNWITSLRSQ